DWVNTFRLPVRCARPTLTSSLRGPVMIRGQCGSLSVFLVSAQQGCHGQDLVPFDCHSRAVDEYCLGRPSTEYGLARFTWYGSDYGIRPRHRLRTGEAVCGKELVGFCNLPISR